MYYIRFGCIFSPTRPVVKIIWFFSCKPRRNWIKIHPAALCYLLTAFVIAGRTVLWKCYYRDAHTRKRCICGISSLYILGGRKVPKDLKTYEVTLGVLVLINWLSLVRKISWCKSGIDKFEKKKMDNAYSCCNQFANTGIEWINWHLRA